RYIKKKTLLVLVLQILVRFKKIIVLPASTKNIK
ncbi:MAG: hypothetical protein ACI90V_012133, partial [Bacillariaceae sp.]